MRIGASLSHVGKYNENAVIHALRGLGPASQTEIAEVTGLSVKTVSAIVKNLTARGYLREVRTVSVGRGRPRVIIDIVSSARYSVGIHVDPSVVTAVVLDLRGTVVGSVASEEVHPDDPDRSMDAAAKLVRALIAEAGLGETGLIGACLAVPGPLQTASSSIVESVWLPGWTDYDLGAALERRLGMSVPVVKDTLAAVIGENWVRAREVLDSTMVFVYLGTGIGVGLSLNGEPVRGFSGNAGEIGRMLLTLSSLSGNPGTGLNNDPVVMVETAYASGVLPGPAPERRELAETEKQFGQLCHLAESGDDGAVAILSAAAGRIAEMVVMTTELLDADVVVFGGPYWQLVKPWYESAVEAALAEPSARGPHPVKLHSTAMGRHVGAIGAASVVLDARYVPRAPSGMGVR